MIMKRIEKKKEGKIVTEVKVTPAELKSPVTKSYLLTMGIDYTKPAKTSARFQIFYRDGDWMNVDRKKVGLA